MEVAYDVACDVAYDVACDVACDVAYEQRPKIKTFETWYTGQLANALSNAYPASS